MVLAVKNLVRYKRSITGIWLAITIIFVFSFTISTYIESVENHFEITAKFEVGADYRIDFLIQERSEIENFIQNNISNIIAYTEVNIADLLYPLNEDLLSRTSIDILGIDPSTFFETCSDNPRFDLYPSQKNN